MNGSKYQGKSYYIKIDKLLTNTFVAIKLCQLKNLIWKKNNKKKQTKTNRRKPKQTNRKQVPKGHRTCISGENTYLPELTGNQYMLKVRKQMYL
jgi:hypothetical protein